MRFFSKMKILIYLKKKQQQQQQFGVLFCFELFRWMFSFHFEKISWLWFPELSTAQSPFFRLRLRDYATGYITYILVKY